MRSCPQTPLEGQMLKQYSSLGIVTEVVCSCTGGDAGEGGMPGGMPGGGPTVEEVD